MLNMDIYIFITALSAVAFAIMGLELALKRIPSGDAFAKLRMARTFMVIGYALMVAFPIAEFFCSKEYNSDTAMLFMLISASYQCMMFVAILLTCLNPAFITYRRVLVWAVSTTAWIVPCCVAYFMGVTWIVYVLYALYINQVVVSFVLFLPKYMHNMSILRATDKKHRLHLEWISWAFYTAITLNVLVMIVVWLPAETHIAFTAICVAFFLWFSTRFSSFAAHLFTDYLPILTRAGLTDEPIEQDEEYKQRSAACKEKVDAWIARQGYREPDDDRAAAAIKMGLDKDDLQWYCAVCLKQDFRAWRVGLRIQDAKEILDVNPEVPINELASALGFNTRSNFYMYFKKITGESTTEYINRVHNKEEK